MPYSVNVIKLLEKVDPSTREVLIAVLEEIEKQRQVTVTKTEFNELKDIVNELAQAHLRSEKRLAGIEKTLNELAEAQKKTEQRVNELAEAQKKTEQRLDELAEAQKKTEQRVNELAEAQKKTEQRLDELAEAQKKTEEELKKLIREHRKSREQIGGLSHTIGYLLEDRAYIGLGPLMERDLGVKLVTPLKRDFLEIGPGRYLEINIIGKAAQNGNKIWIVGECKTQLKKRDVDKFLKTLDKAREILGGDLLPVIVVYQASPQLQNYVKEKEIRLYFSYQLPLAS